MTRRGLDGARVARTETRDADARIRCTERVAGIAHSARIEPGSVATRRRDPIGDGRLCLIPASPPKEALEARRRAANEETCVHAGEAGMRPTVGYRQDRGRPTGRVDA